MDNFANFLRSNRILHFVIAILWSFIIGGIVLLMLRGDIQIPSRLQIGPVNLRMYSFILFAAVIIGVFTFEQFRRREKQFASLDVWEGLTYTIIPAIIGARIYHVLTDFELYRNNLIQVFQLWNGGIGFIGGVIGGAIGAYIFARRKGYDIQNLLGILVLSLPLAHAFGRLGNLINYELYGLPTDQPWGLYVPHDICRAPAIEISAELRQ